METLQREKKMKDKKKMKKTPYKDILNESIIDKRFFRTDRERDLANARKLCEFENANSVIITEIFPEDLVPKDRSFRAMKEKALKNVRKISIW